MNHCNFCGGFMVMRDYNHKKGTGYICFMCGRSDDEVYENYVKREKQKPHHDWMSVDKRINPIKLTLKDVLKKGGYIDEDDILDSNALIRNSFGIYMENGSDESFD